MPQFTRLFSVLLIAFSALCTVSALTCTCDKAKCPVHALNCGAGQTTLDRCNCCLVCLQGINQTCGGLHGELGVCKPDLQCVYAVRDDIGRYQETDLGTCQDVTSIACNLHHSWGCQVVSPSDCACLNISSCDNPVLLPFQTLEECMQALQEGFAIRKVNCSRETCLAQPLQMGEERRPCPPDSYQIMDKPKNQHHGCECLPSACQTVKCPEGSHPKIIRQGSKVPGSCCTLFECLNETATCEYDMVKYQSGETWTTGDGCSQCSCENSLIFCQAVNCDTTKTCSYMTVPPGECCPVCSGCISPSGKMNKNGVVWKEDDCTTCQCVEGKLVCQAEMCHRSCSNPKTVPGQCCPVCDDENSVEETLDNRYDSKQMAPSVDTCRGDDNKRYGKGEMWFDGCRHCYCHNGREMCTVLTCPVLHCSHPRLLPGSCCPTCSRKSFTREHPYSFTVCQAVDGNFHLEGETWSLDPCTWCLCMQGQVLCEATQCPPTPCMHPTHHLGSCCSTCADSGHSVTTASTPSSGHSLTPSAWCYSEDGATVYVDGHKWRPTPCQSCVCQKGKVQCFQETCPSMEDCPHPMLVKHRCCPVCLGSKSTRRLQCLQDGKTYHDGERWTVNECTSCVCLKGMQMCTEKICSAWCPQPIRIPGQCCPLCKGESLEYSPQSQSQQHLSLAMVIICAGIMLLLFFVVLFLVLVLLRQRKVLNNGSRVSQGLCPRQRPKSTNLELQGMSPCNKPLLESAELKKLHEQGSPVMKNMV